jgi:hypothetical protein
MVQKNRSLGERLRGRNQLDADDPFLALVRQIIIDERDLAFVGIE